MLDSCPVWGTLLPWSMVTTEATKMTLSSLLSLARKNLGGEMESSARLCLADAVAANDAGDFEAAVARATKSLLYSVGCFHPDYVRATSCAKTVGA